MSKRIGVIGIIIEDPKSAAHRVNTILSQYGHLITGRMGIPNHKENVGVIALIIEGNTDEVGALTGKLGNLPGVTVKSALTAKTIEKGENLHD
ncbi:TM1266 family iron-only hydrogenase system putative regulator [Propionispora vibrioides]|uniref:Putative iron-only hydrogenase system regulator n=1 Tax=Propionispora vibrioides TaxID=112903 RepID=A0A1H8XUK5_9FIRM|nr:TM1266 family iron-only hydrogenase system putative regulator [Propionispora vibrioides]SEP43549.1 putative iron-only hydrogenase system regulator [Propionispora vibrioides]